MIRMYKNKVQTMKESIFKDSKSIHECREKALTTYSDEELRSYLSYNCSRKWRKTNKEYYESQLKLTLDEVVKIILQEGEERFWVQFDLEYSKVVTVKEGGYLHLKGSGFLHYLTHDKTKAYNIYSSLFKRAPEFLDYDCRIMTEERMDNLISNKFIELINNYVYRVNKDFEVVVSTNDWKYCAVRNDCCFEVADADDLWKYIEYCINN